MNFLPIRSHSSLIILIFLVFFFPQFLDKVGLALEYVLTVLVLGWTLIYLFVYKKSISIVSVYIFGVYSSFLLLSLVRSREIIVVSDFFELLKPILFLLVYNYSRAIFIQLDDKDLIWFVRSLMLVFFVAALWGVLESFLPAWNYLSSVVYKGARAPVQGKAMLSFISPYTFSALLVLPSSYFLLRVIAGNHQLGSSLLGFFVTASALFLTQSRTVAISFVLTLILCLSFLWVSGAVPKVKRFRISMALLFVAVALGVPLILVYLKLYLPYLYGGLELLFTRLIEADAYDIIYSTPSISNRYEQLIEVIGIQDELPFVGVAIAKSKIVPESLYAMYLLRVGGIGLILHLYMISYACYLSFNLSKRYRFSSQELSVFFLGVMFYMFSLPFSYLSSAVNDQVRSGFIFYMLLALVFTLRSKKLDVEV